MYQVLNGKESSKYSGRGHHGYGLVSFHFYNDSKWVQ